jgi:nucleotide-binding universal stress UspA family protein
VIEFERILCPVDFSETSVRALAHAAALARWYEAELSVLHVVPTFEPVLVRGDIDGPVRIVTPMPPDAVADEMRRSLDLAALAPGAVPVVESGDPRTAIVDYAVAHHADLIVLGTQATAGSSG